MPDLETIDLTRRKLLVAASGAGALGLAGVFGMEALEGGDDAETEPVDDEERARRLAEQFAPTLYFDEHEPWLPTDPRPYEREVDGETVVDGFAAFDGYSRRFDEAGEPPEPTVFYRVVRYADSPLAVVQYWYYAAFDQFSANFHWHDWEVVHAFVDLETEEPQLYVASAHSRKVPNNEFLDPDPEVEPRILSELGSHSSALSVNEIPDRFQRLPVEDTIADITNRMLEGVEEVAELPLAYGLPRDEGFRLPYVVPELDDAPIHEHDELPSVSASDLVDDALTVRSFDALGSPPEDLPERSTGTVFGHGGATGADVDVSYDLVPTAELEHVAAFTGPQLSFEFAVPDFAEDAVAGHITSTGVPWEQPRYDNPAADISGPYHRATLAGRYDAIGEPAPVNRAVAGVRELVGSDVAPEDEGLTAEEPAVEAVALLESDPVAVPTFGGVAVVEDVPEGEHRLTVNGPGSAPYAERIEVAADEEGPALAGVDGRVGLVANEDAVKLEVDADGTDADLESLAVEDDFAGRVYDAPLDGPDAVYLHRGGAFATEVVDADDERGAFRVNPGVAAEDGATDGGDGGGGGGDGGDRGAPIRIDRPDTGKASLASFLADVSTETAGRVRAEVDDEQDGGPPSRIRGLARALEAIAASAERAVERANAGDAEGADERLEAVETLLQRAAERLEEAREDLPEPVAAATDRRLDQARRRTEQAKDAEKL
jgi:hypothetical protein